jgi:hypothetical protein
MATTGNSSLCPHIEREHREEYVRLCKEKGWQNQLPVMMKAAAASLTASLPDTGPFGGKRVPFSQEGFLRQLIKFIVSNDLV